MPKNAEKIRENPIRKNSKSLNSSKKILKSKILCKIFLVPKKKKKKKILMPKNPKKLRKISPEKILESKIHPKNSGAKIRQKNTEALKSRKVRKNPNWKNSRYQNSSKKILEPKIRIFVNFSAKNYSFLHLLPTTSATFKQKTKRCTG